MTRKITICYSSDCPYTNQEQTINITYNEISLLGSPTPGYKIMKFSCSYQDECPYPLQSRSGYCPVMDSAPEQPY